MKQLKLKNEILKKLQLKNDIIMIIKGVWVELTLKLAFV